MPNDAVQASGLDLFVAEIGERKRHSTATSHVKQQHDYHDDINRHIDSCGTKEPIGVLGQ